MRPWLRSWRRPPQQLIFDFKTSKPQINISIVDFLPSYGADAVIEARLYYGKLASSAQLPPQLRHALV